jgi:hypothetical protein
MDGMMDLCQPQPDLGPWDYMILRFSRQIKSNCSLVY